MEEALTMLTELGHEFGLSAEVAHMITLIRQYERLTGECSGVGEVLHWMESATHDLGGPSAACSASSQTAVVFHHDATRLMSYVDRLRALGFAPTSPPSIPEPPADGGQV